MVLALPLTSTSRSRTVPAPLSYFACPAPFNPPDEPLATASVALRMEGRRVRQAQVGLGQGAPIPWRAEAAEKALAQIGGEIREQWDVEGVAIAHRTGRLGVGEITVGIAASPAHRAEAFDACRYAIERIKQIVPIWKKEFYADGDTWIGSEAEYQAAFGRSAQTDTAGEPS